MEWKWSKANEKSLAQFVTEQAIHQLPKLPENPFDLNQTPEGRRKFVETLYNTLITQDIRYAYEKYHPEAETQRIRTPHEILNSPGEGTCLDLALLFCGLCFGYDLLPLLIIIQGHAFTAISLNHSRREWDSFARDRSLFNTPNLLATDENLAQLQQLIDSGAYIAVECTGFSRTQSFSGSEPEASGRTDEGILTFDRAVAAGREQLDNPQRPFQFAIDIAVARYSWKIDPLPLMDIAAFTEFLAPFIPALTNGAPPPHPNDWDKAQAVWQKLHPQVETEDAAQMAVRKLADDPDSETWKAVLKEGLETLLQHNRTLTRELAQILEEKQPDDRPSIQFEQNVQGQQNQTIGTVSGGTISNISGGTVYLNKD